MMPLYQAEAMWISFSANWWSRGRYPCAIKVAAGKINAISGKLWEPELDGSDRDYIVVPEQPWLDGPSRSSHGTLVIKPGPPRCLRECGKRMGSSTALGSQSSSLGRT